jgi:hypothetical protein
VTNGHDDQTNPPGLATWLLQRLAVNDSIIGDLIERYRNGRSAAWYWRQALFAIIAGAFHDVRAHKLLALRAIVLGYVCCETFMYGAGAFVLHFVGRETPLPVLLLLLGCCAIAAGWIVSRLHPRSMILAYVGFCWVASVCVYAIYKWLPVMDRQPFPVLAFFVILDFVVMPFGFLMGGLWRPSVRGKRRKTVWGD